MKGVSLIMKLRKVTREDIRTAQQRHNRTSVSEAVALWAKGQQWATEVADAHPESRFSREAAFLAAKVGEIVVAAQMRQMQGGTPFLPAFDAALLHNRMADLADLSVRVSRLGTPEPPTTRRPQRSRKNRHRRNRTPLAA